MSLTIDATPGSASANSFVTEAEQIAYMAARLNATAWTTFSGTTCTETEKAAMIEATRELTTRQYVGQRATATQALQWPRAFAENPDSPWPGILWFGTTEIPQRVKDATCELAFQFLNLGTTDLASQDPNIDIKRKQIDVIVTDYNDPGQRARQLGRFPRVLNYLRPLLTDTGANAPVIRG